jgi:hypothetical protein
MANAIEAVSGFTFGCDPELFVVNPEGVYVSAEGLIPGTKSEPYKVDLGAVQVDGMAAEFNIDPVDNYKDWEKNIVTVMKQLQGMLPPGYKLRNTASVQFDKTVWEKTPDDAKALGCQPDFDAWTGGVNPPGLRPESAPTLCCAGGHIHFGWTKEAELDETHLTNCRDLVKQLDWYLGGWSLTQDKDNVRRKLYGKAGACRYKDYGVEYRTLSNFWVGNSSYRRYVWDRMQTAIWDMTMKFQPDRARTQEFDFNERLVKSINTSRRDVELESMFRFPLKTMEAEEVYG